MPLKLNYKTIEKKPLNSDIPFFSTTTYQDSYMNKLNL